MASPDADDVAVLHRIEVDVIEVPRKIVRVAQRMLPISPLPDPALGFGGTAGGDRFTRGKAREKPLLIRRQRVAKSASPSGRVQIAWR